MPQCREDLAADAEIRVPHMRAFDSLGQGQRDAAELVGSHYTNLILRSDP